MAPNTCGSAYGVVTAFACRRFPAPGLRRRVGRAAALGQAHPRPRPGDAEEPVLCRGLRARPLHLPRTVDPDGTVHTAITEQPRAQWPVLIHDHHEAYIAWADYLSNEARLAANRTHDGARPPREGSALCQGIIYCGSCGKPMRTDYHTETRPAYECSSRADRLTTPSCRSVAAATVDAAVAGVLLDALTPEQVALALAAADEVTGRHRCTSRAAELAVERARYEADRAERAFSQVEPENRLVARSLEARWEARLTALAEAEQALTAAAGSLPPLPGRAELEKLAADLPGLWHAPATSNKDRKRLLRTLIADVTLLPEPDRGKVRIGIRWHTGATDELRVTRAVHPGTARRSPSPAVEMVRQLGPVTPTAELARQLNAAGMVTGNGRPFDVKAVQWIRHAYRIPAPAPCNDGEISVADAARRLGCSAGVVYYWIENGQLSARRGPGNRLCIPWNDRTETAARERVPHPATSTPKPGEPGPASATDRALECRCTMATSEPAPRSTGTASANIQKRHGKDGQYEVTVPAVADRVVQAAAEAGAGARFRGGLRARLLRVPAEAARPGRDRRDPLPRHPGLPLGAGRGHRGGLRQRLAHGRDGPGAGTGQGQASPGAGEAFLKAGVLTELEEHRETPHRHAAGRHRHAPNATANFRACHPPCRLWCRGGRRRWMVPGRGCGGGW